MTISREKYGKLLTFDKKTGEIWQIQQGKRDERGEEGEGGGEKIKNKSGILSGKMVVFLAESERKSG